VKARKLIPSDSQTLRQLSRLGYGARHRVYFSLVFLFSGYPILAQSSPSPAAQATPTAQPTVELAAVCAPAPPSDPNSSASIHGTVMDSTATPVIGAVVTLTRDDPSPAREASVLDDGQFLFSNLAPGSFHLAVASPGFATLTAAGNLLSGQNCALPQMSLTLAMNVTEVRVELTTAELAQEQIREQERQRLLGVIPNFYVSYAPHAAPLTSKQKFELAWKSTVDPVSFGVTAAFAGVQQATNSFSGYGQGAQGYAKRYGASYADLVTSTFLGSAIFPSILKQDPRYFYKGTGSIRSRALYAMANAVICKGDNRHWQPNYSGIMGSLAAGGISNLYYPATDRGGASLTFENTLIGIGETAAVNLLQEFVMRRLTTNVPNYEPAIP
jgi:Carboxypeptidase regulatory-like domain